VFHLRDDTLYPRMQPLEVITLVLYTKALIFSSDLQNYIEKMEVFYYEKSKWHRYDCQIKGES
jgi:hypothetical protein